MDRIDLSSKIVEQHRLEGSSLAQHPSTKNRHGEFDDLQALKRACKDFESIFVYTLLKTMRATLPKPEGAGTSREFYTSMGDLEVARAIAHGRGVGLGDLLFEQLKHKGRESSALG